MAGEATHQSQRLDLVNEAITHSQGRTAAKKGTQGITSTLPRQAQLLQTPAHTPSPSPCKRNLTPASDSVCRAATMLPCDVIQGITNVDAYQLNVSPLLPARSIPADMKHQTLLKFVCRYVFAGKPLANMVFEILSGDVVSRGNFSAQDQRFCRQFKRAVHI